MVSHTTKYFSVFPSDLLIFNVKKMPVGVSIALLFLEVKNQKSKPKPNPTKKKNKKQQQKLTNQKTTPTWQAPPLPCITTT